MHDFRRVAPGFWTGKTGKALKAKGSEAVIVALYLMTCQHTNMLGLYYLSKTYIAVDTPLGFEGASKGLQGAFEAGFCEYDEESEVVWVYEMASYQIGEQLDPKDNRCKGVQREYDALPENPYLARFYEQYADKFHMSACRGEQPKKARGSKGASKPLRSQEKDKEQEQKKHMGGKPPGDLPPGFVRFWAVWPASLRKQAKGECLKSWMKGGAESLVDEVVAHVERMKQSELWTKSNGQYVPAPLVYLNQRRWEGASDDGSLFGEDARGHGI